MADQNSAGLGLMYVEDYVEVWQNRSKRFKENITLKNVLVGNKEWDENGEFEKKLDQEMDQMGSLTRLIADITKAKSNMPDTPKEDIKNNKY